MTVIFMMGTSILVRWYIYVEVAHVVFIRVWHLFFNPLDKNQTTICYNLCNICVFSCDQAALWMVFSVRLSVCLSVCLSVTPFWLCSHHRIIMKFSRVITNDKSDVHAKGQGQRSKVKVTEVNTQLNRFPTVTPVWIHIWWWNDAYSLMMLRRGALLFLKVILQISRSHGSKKRQIWPRLGVSGLQLLFEFTNGYEIMHKAWSSIEEVPYCFWRSSVKFQGHTALKV